MEPVVPGGLLRSSATSRSTPASDLVPVRVTTYPGHGSFGPDARRGAGQDQDAALPAPVRSPERGHGGIAGTTAVLAELNEYQGFLPLPPEASGRVSVRCFRSCPTTSARWWSISRSTSSPDAAVLERWPVDARGFLGGPAGTGIPTPAGPPHSSPMKEGLS